MKKSLLFLLFLCSWRLLAGCGSANSAPPPPPRVSSLAVVPQFIFVSVGGTEQLTASATLSDGSMATPPSACWSSSDTKIVTVSPQGVASALATGTATITCTDEGVMASTTLTVQPAFSTSAFQSGTILYLENLVGTDDVRLGMDTSFGGAIGVLSLNGSDVVAKASYGSHFFGVGLFDGDDTRYYNCGTCTQHYGWNPTECCDEYRHGSPVLAQSIVGDTIYIKSNPLEWVPDDKGGGPTLPVPSDIIMEKWISPLANHPYDFQVRYKLTHTGTPSSTTPSPPMKLLLVFSANSIFIPEPPRVPAHPRLPCRCLKRPCSPFNGSRKVGARLPTSRTSASPLTTRKRFHM